MIILGQPACLKAGRDCGASLDGLLIKSRSFFALAEGSIGTDWYKDSIVATVLRRNKPLERLDPRGEHCFVFTVPSGQNECLRQPCVRVGEALLKPMPRVVRKYPAGDWLECCGGAESLYRLGSVQGTPAVRAHRTPMRADL